MEGKKVYAAINAVQCALSKTGITKGREAKDWNGKPMYAFRGIDDVYNVISPLLAEHHLCIIPRMVSRDCVERKSTKGAALFYVTVEAEFDFVSADDGSVHTARTFGEAMDSGDKATNKAMSAAYKYACFQTFAIPTEGDNDADATVHEPIAPKSDFSDLEDPDDWTDVFTAMGDASTVEELQSIFGSAWKKAHQKDKPSIKKEYDRLKAILEKKNV